MPFSCCRQSFGRAFALPPRTAGSAAARSLARPAMEDIMGPFLYVIAILVMMSRPLLAQENSAEIPTPAPRPQPQVQPPPVCVSPQRWRVPAARSRHRCGRLVQPECGRLDLRPRPRRARRSRPRDCAAATGQRRIEERIAGTRRRESRRAGPGRDHTAPTANCAARRLGATPVGQIG